MQCSFSRTLGMFTVVWISCGVHSGNEAFCAEDSDFQIIGAPDTDSRAHTGPSGNADFPSPPVPEGFPDFHLIGPAREPAADLRLSDSERAARWTAAARRLDFTVLGPLAKDKPPKPVVYVYSAPPGMSCHACDQLARHAGQLPYTLEWQRAPVWVQAFPTLHWQAANGAWKKCEGWPGAVRFQQIYEDSQRKK